MHGSPNKVDNVLRRENIPDACKGTSASNAAEECAGKPLTIAGQNYEFVLIQGLMNKNVGVGRDDLVLWIQACVLLELKVTQGARKGKIACSLSKHITW